MSTTLERIQDSDEVFIKVVILLFIAIIVFLGLWQGALEHESKIVQPIAKSPLTIAYEASDAQLDVILNAENIRKKDKKHILDNQKLFYKNMHSFCGDNESCYLQELKLRQKELDEMYQKYRFK